MCGAASSRARRGSRQVWRGDAADDILPSRNTDPAQNSHCRGLQEVQMIIKFQTRPHNLRPTLAVIVQSGVTGYNAHLRSQRLMFALMNRVA
uniref:Uncharacterized protein n=1 Tax=Oryza meridionalis TaxID=40149 RepID=A0A0E0DZL2_9ORYZ